jgi:cell division protein FtsQ
MPGKGTRKAAVIVVGVAAFATAAYWLYQSPVFSVRHVTVAGNSVLSDQELREVSGLEGDRLLQPDFDGAEDRIAALPGVRDVEVSRDWPMGARVTVVERRPWGIWEAAGQRYTIDDEGVILDMAALDGSPLIRSVEGAASPLKPGDAVEPSAVGVAQELVATADQTVGLPVSALEFSQASGLTAVLGAPGTEGLRVTFGDAQAYEFKIASLYAVLEQARAEGRTLVRVDLRFGDRVAVQ